MHPCSSSIEASGRRSIRVPMFPGTVYDLPREATARERMERQADWFGAHRDDRVVDE
jgi:hypothetical protein